jgi:hypothetical protein
MSRTAVDVEVVRWTDTGAQRTQAAALDMHLIPQVCCMAIKNSCSF